MQRTISFALSVVLASAMVLVLSGCENGGRQKMSMSSSSNEHQMKCQACYDEVKAVRKHMVKGTAYEVVRKHKCSGCNAESTVYSENGVLMFECPGCTPEGIACDKCRPPKGRS